MTSCQPISKHFRRHRIHIGPAKLRVGVQQHQKPQGCCLDHGRGNLDFGLAAHRSQFGEATADPGMFGTIPYMSPEQSAGHPVTEAADWYAVGVMLFEALTGTPPFTM